MLNKSAITISSDYKYVKYLKRALDTINIHGTIADIYVYAVNFTDKQIHDLDGYNIQIIRDNNHLLSTCNNIIKTGEIEDNTNRNAGILSKDIKHISSLLYSEQGVYTCHSRFKNINFLLANGYNNILCLDADTVFNKNIDHIFNKIDKDLYIIPVIIDGIERIFDNEGMLFINNNKNTISFFKEVYNFIFTGDKWRNWDADADALNYIMKINPLSIGRLDYRYKDNKFNNNSYMWSGDGDAKYLSKFNKLK